MKHRLRAATWAIVAAAGLAASSLAAASAGAASPSPLVSLTPAHTSINDTGRSAYHYRARNAHLGSRVVLQVKRGHSWRSIARSGLHHGTFGGTFRVNGPGVPTVLYLRAILVHGSTTDVSSGPRRIYAFGHVPLLALCKSLLGNDPCEAGTATFDGNTPAPFHYVMTSGINEPGDGFVAEFGAKATTCRSITLRYISDSPDNTNTYLQVRQPGRPAQKWTSSSSKVSTVTMSLSGGAFAVGVAQDASQIFMYYSGSGYCYSSSGRP